MSRTDYRRICKNRIALMNRLDIYPSSDYRIVDNGSRYAIFYGDHTRISSYLTWPELYNWIDGYQTAYYEVHQAKLAEMR